MTHYYSTETVKKSIKYSPITKEIFNWWIALDDDTKQNLCNNYCFTKRNGYQYPPYQTLSNEDITNVYKKG